MLWSTDNSEIWRFKSWGLTSKVLSYCGRNRDVAKMLRPSNAHPVFQFSCSAKASMTSLQERSAIMSPVTECERLSEQQSESIRSLGFPACTTNAQMLLLMPKESKTYDNCCYPCPLLPQNLASFTVAICEYGMGFFLGWELRHPSISAGLTNEFESICSGHANRGLTSSALGLVVCHP